MFDPDSLPPLKKVTPEYGQRRKVRLAAWAEGGDFVSCDREAEGRGGSRGASRPVPMPTCALGIHSWSASLDLSSLTALKPPHWPQKTPWTAREEDVLLKYCQHPMYKAGNWRMIKDHDRVNGNHLFDRSIVSED